MAQGKVPEQAATGAGERAHLQGRAVPLPEAAARAYGGLVLLAKPLPSRAGYYAPLALVRLQDQPKGLRRQIAAGGGHGAAAGSGGFYAPAPAPAPLSDEGAARHLPLLRAAHPVVVPEGLSRQHAGVVSRPEDDTAVKFAGDGDSDAVVGDGNSNRHGLRLMAEGGKWVVVDGMEDGLFEMAEGISHLAGKAWFRDPNLMVANDKSESSNMGARSAAEAEMGVFYDSGLPATENAERIVALVLHKKNPVDGEMGAFYVPENAARLLDINHGAEHDALDYSDGLVFPREDAVPLLLGSNRAAEQGAHCNDDVLVPSPGNLMPAGKAPLLASRSSTYAVQVSIDAAAGAKAGDPIAVDVKAAAGGEDARHEHGSVSAVVGIVAASSAATAVATGAVGLAAAFGLFALLVGGLSLAMSSVRAQ